jgi:hypothetical protein
MGKDGHFDNVGHARSAKLAESLAAALRDALDYPAPAAICGSSRITDGCSPEGLPVASLMQASPSRTANGRVVRSSSRRPRQNICVGTGRFGLPQRRAPEHSLPARKLSPQKECQGHPQGVKVAHTTVAQAVTSGGNVCAWFEDCALSIRRQSAYDDGRARSRTSYLPHSQFLPAIAISAVTASAGTS